MRISDLDTPALLLDTYVLSRNIDRMASYARNHGLRLRPHTKTHKIPAIARMQIKAGASGITVAKVGEAEIMAAAGLQDILVAYPLWGVAKLDRLAAVARRAAITIAADSVAVARALSEHAVAGGYPLRLMAEADTGFHRCGVPVGARLIELCDCIASLPGVEFAGVFTYPGHIWGDPEIRRRQATEEGERLEAMIGLLAQNGIERPAISGGSTPAAFFCHLMRGLTEMRPGTYVFNDMNTVYQDCATVADSAARVVVTVVSVSVDDQAIVDGGSKTFSSDGLLSGDGRGYGLVAEAPDLRVDDMNEEHGFIRLDNTGHRFKVGDRLTIIPNHICTTVNMHEHIYAVAGEDVVECWPVEGRGKIR
jgi:D-serine deaminase-like pyridoxal phosphate-dependent protein